MEHSETLREIINYLSERYFLLVRMSEKYRHESVEYVRCDTEAANLKRYISFMKTLYETQLSIEEHYQRAQHGDVMEIDGAQMVFNAHVGEFEYMPFAEGPEENHDE